MFGGQWLSGELRMFAQVLRVPLVYGSHSLGLNQMTAIGTNVSVSPCVLRLMLTPVRCTVVSEYCYSGVLCGFWRPAMMDNLLLRCESVRVFCKTCVLGF